MKTSAIARYLTAYRGVPTLFIASKKVLLDDAAGDFKNGIDGINDNQITQIKDGWFGNINLRKTQSYTQESLDSELDDKGIVVATIQSLNARLEDARTKQALLAWLHNKCKLVICDECQNLGTRMWDDVMSEVYAPYRVGLSATPTRTDNATLKIFATTGPIVFETSGDQQIGQGRLCNLDIQYHVFDHKMFNESDKDLNYADMYTSCIVENDRRNLFIIDRTFEMLQEERQVLVLIQFIEHGHLLRELFLNHGMDIDDVRFVWGDTPDKIRQQAIEDFRKGKFRVMIGSTIADVGLDVRTISGVVLCGAGNSQVTHVQRIGRGARNCDYEKEWGYIPKFIRDANGQKITRVIDLIDKNVCFFSKQSKNRYYQACEEFGADRVHIVGGDKSVFRSAPKAAKERVSTEEAEALNQDLFTAFQSIDRDKLDSVEVKPVDDLICDFLKGWGK